jgi:hypothetical protein
LDFKAYEECLQESRMREIRTSGLTRGSNGIGANRPLLSTLLVKNSLKMIENLAFKIGFLKIFDHGFHDQHG